MRAAFGVEGVPYLVCIGRVDDQKGTGMLWRFFRAYKQRHPGPLRLVFVGQVVDAPEAAEDIVLTGMVDDDAKWALLRGAQVHVAPSPHESFSLTVIEALTAGIPVLVNARVRCRRESTASSRGPGCGSPTSPNSRPPSACSPPTPRGARRCGPTGAATSRPPTPGR